MRRHADGRTSGRADARIGVPAHRRTAFALRALLLCVCCVSASVRPAAGQQCPDGTPAPCVRPAAGPPPNSVAVLPFANLMRDTADAYLSPGLASEISNSLSGVPRLDVRSPALAQRPSGDAVPDPRALGRRHNVRYVVEGDFQRGGDRLRVRVRLITVATGTQRWSSAYTRPVADLLAVQEEIAREVASSIAGQLLPPERAALAVHATRNPAAYDHLLRGNFFLARRTREDIGRAIEEYDQAAGRDPALAQAHARIALGYALLLERDQVGSLSRDSALARGFRAAERALTADSASADGWMAKGYLLAIRDPREYAGVMPAFERAVALDPRNPEVLHQYASKLWELGQGERAVTAERQALAIEPARPISHMVIALVYEGQRRFELAELALDSALAIDPFYLDAFLDRAYVRLLRGESAAAHADADEALRLSTGVRRSAWALEAAALAAGGDSAAARTALAHALAPEEQERYGLMDMIWIAVALESCGRTDDAIAMLARMPRGAVTWAAIDRRFPNLHGDPRFQQVLEANRPSGAPR